MSTVTTTTKTSRRQRRPQKQQPRKRKQTVVKTTVVQRPVKRKQKQPSQRKRKNYINVRKTITPYEIDEMVDIVLGNPDFTVKSYALNPGNANLFPLLSKHARLFDRYEFDDLEFSFQPDQSYIGVQGQAGFVDMSVTADAIQPPPQSQQAAEILPHCPQGPLLTSKPWSLVIPKKFMENALDDWRFVRPDGNIPGGADPHLYDCGQVFLWVSGQTNTTKCGQFKVKGRVRCYNSVLEPNSLPPPNYSASQLMQTQDQNLVNGVNFTVPLSDTSVSSGYANGLGVTNNLGVVKTQPGNYLISATSEFIASGNSTSFTMAILKNGSIVAQANNTLPSAVYGGWSLNIPSVYVQMTTSDALSIIVVSSFSTGATVLSDARLTIVNA